MCGAAKNLMGRPDSTQVLAKAVIRAADRLDISGALLAKGMRFDSELMVTNVGEGTGQ